MLSVAKTATRCTPVSRSGRSHAWFPTLTAMSSPTSPTFATLELAGDGPVRWLWLNQPKRLNALSNVMLTDLAEAAAWLDHQLGVKVVIVGGRGRAFSAGFDLGDFSGSPADGRSARDRPARDAADLGRQMAEAVARVRPITIAAVHGHCVGGGLVLAAACDLRIAADDARFSIPEVDLGIPLAWGGIPRLVRELGPAITKELVLTCRPFDAGEARALRFVNRVVPLDELEPAVEKLASDLATKSALTLEATKRQVETAIDSAFPTAGAHADADALLSALGDPESRAAGAAYLERRAARRQQA